MERREKHISIKEAATILGFTEQAVRYAIVNGRLRGFKRFKREWGQKHWRVNQRDVIYRKENGKYPEFMTFNGKKRHLTLLKEAPPIMQSIKSTFLPVPDEELRECNERQIKIIEDLREQISSAEKLQNRTRESRDLFRSMYLGSLGEREKERTTLQAALDRQHNIARLRSQQLMELFGENIIPPSLSEACTVEDALNISVENRKQEIAEIQSTVECRDKQIESYRKSISNLERNIATLRSTIDTDNERIKDLESYQSILKDDSRMREEKIIQLQSQMDEAFGKIAAQESEINILKIEKSALQLDVQFHRNESHKRGLKIKGLLEQIDQLTPALQQTKTQRDNWRSFYTNLRDNQPVSIWQKIIWVFTH